MSGYALIISGGGGYISVLNWYFLFIFSPMGGAYSLSSIEDTLHPSLQTPLQPNVERRLEYDFHNSSYHSLTEIVVGLKTALGHLVKVSCSSVLF